MIVTTSATIDGKPIQEYLGVAAGEAIMGANALKDFSSGIRDLVGGRSASYEQVINKAREIAMNDLVERARALGANAIVGGSVPIATGAAMAQRYLGSDDVTICFAGDGAYANGVVLESLNWASQYQWKNFLAGDKAYGLPIVYVIQNNHYGMTHRTDDEVMGIKALAVRGAGFAEDGMHAEVVNGMDVLAVRDAVSRATELCRNGEGPVIIEASTYRYYGHSLSDPRNEYRTKEEEEAWSGRDPIKTMPERLMETIPALIGMELRKVGEIGERRTDTRHDPGQLGEVGPIEDLSELPESKRRQAHLQGPPQGEPTSVLELLHGHRQCAVVGAPGPCLLERGRISTTAGARVGRAGSVERHRRQSRRTSRELEVVSGASGRRPSG